MWRDLKAILAAVPRLAGVEKKHAEVTAENRAALKDLRVERQARRERQVRIAARPGTPDGLIPTGAQASAALALARDVAPLRERLARLEAVGAGAGRTRLPIAAAGPGDGIGET